MSATMTTTLGTSNMRGSSRQTRTNPTRSSKTISSSQRQNSLISNPPVLPQSTSESHGFYPAISHFADAIAALPREYRRHASLLKEVDAKAWAPEENLKALLTKALAERPAVPAVANVQNAAGSTGNTADEAVVLSAANSTDGAPLDVGSQYSSQSVEAGVIQRRQLLAAVRHNLMQIMVTMDEKNHVINNANEELSRHIRRLDSIFPHISDEISEEARLGSLKHWAYPEISSTKKVAAPASRREAAASLAIMHDSDIAGRSESRREAMLAKKRGLNQQQVDSDFEEARPTSRKVTANGKRREIPILDLPGLGITGTGASKRKKPDKTLGGVGMERSITSAPGGRAMSREPSHQDNTKKRKNGPAATTVARKRLNAGTHDSPKLASSPLAGSFGKDAYGRSPALSSIRPANSRARQNSAHGLDGSRARPASSTSHRNTTSGLTASAPDLKGAGAMAGKNNHEARNTLKDPTTSRLIEDNSGTGTHSDAAIRGGGLPVERTASRQGGNTRTEPDADSAKNKKSVNSPRPAIALITSELRSERAGRGRASKTSTPIFGTFSEARSADSAANANGNGGGNGNGNGNGKNKRSARPRVKDHGLHDSLSPKGLPMKRSHKKGAGLNAQHVASQRLKDEVDLPNPNMHPMESDMSDVDVDVDEHEDEERYCYCNGVSYGEMVACDNRNCVREWFHLDCIGLKSVPKSAKWYCDECKEKLGLGGKKGSGNANGGLGGRG